MLNFLSLAFACGMTACLGAGVNYINEEKQQENVYFHLDNKKMVSYDDEHYTITLTADELNNYTWYNFTACCLDNAYSEPVSKIVYHNTNYPVVDSGIEDDLFYMSFDDEHDGISYNVINDYEIANNFIFLPGLESGVYADFDDSAVLYFNLSNYSTIKFAIELDIQANQQETGMVVVLGEFIEILVSGITSFSTGVAGGIVSMASALFLEVDDGVVTGLSVFGGIVAIFAGLALAVSITTKVYLWVTSLGN